MRNRREGSLAAEIHSVIHLVLGLEVWKTVGSSTIVSESQAAWVACDRGVPERRPQRTATLKGKNHLSPLKFKSQTLDMELQDMVFALLSLILLWSNIS